MPMFMLMFIFIDIIAIVAIVAIVVVITIAIFIAIVVFFLLILHRTSHAACCRQYGSNPFGWISRESEPAGCITPSGPSPKT